MDRRGQESTFTYDSLNRLAGQAYQDGSTVAGSYDANGRLLQASDSAGGTFDYIYDSTGRVINQADQFGSVQYTYDAAGRIVSRRVAGQPEVTYSYDATSNLLNASLPQTAADFTYDARNELLTIARSNGVSSQYTYDPAGRLLSLVHQGGQGVQIPFAYSYDAAGERSTYSTNFTAPQAAINIFDAGERLTEGGATSYTYDDNGNVAFAKGSTGTITYTWDTRNRLQSISAPGGQETTFFYDAGTNLIARTDSGPALNLRQTFVLDRMNVAYIARSNGDNLSVLAGLAIDQHLAVVHASGQVEYGLADATNSTASTVDQNGGLVSQFSYAPFGGTTTTSTYPFQFTGRVPVNGALYYYRARYYDSQAGRFSSEDPLGLGGKEMLLYEYTHDSPLNLTDPTGLASCVAECQDAIGQVGLVSCALITGGLIAATIATGGLTAALVPLAGITLCSMVFVHLSTVTCENHCAPQTCPGQ